MLQRKYPITCLDNSFEIILHFISTIFISSFDRSFQLQLLSFHLLSPRTFCGRILLEWRCPTVERKWILFPLHARSPARAILLLRHFHTVVIYFWDLIWMVVVLIILRCAMLYFRDATYCHGPS